MTQEKAKRVSIQVDSDQYQRLKDSTSWSKHSMKAVVSEMIEWFIVQDRDIQGAIMGSLPQSRRPDFARMVLKEMESGSDTIPFDHERATGVAAKEMPEGQED